MGQDWRQRSVERRVCVLPFSASAFPHFTWPAPRSPGSPSLLLPRAPGAGGEARPGEGWPCLGGLLRYPPRRRCLAADPGRADLGNLPAPQPMGERRPCPRPFSGATDASSALRSPPRAARASRAVALRARGTHSASLASGSRPPRRACPRPSPTPRARAVQGDRTSLWGLPDNAGWGRPAPPLPPAWLGGRPSGSCLRTTPRQLDPQRPR